FLTGESLPVHIPEGGALTAGEVNIRGPITLRALKVGEDTTLRRMASLVEAAESNKNRYTALADKAARVYAPVVHLLALLAFTGWVLATGDVRISLNIAIAVLIITCPCALGLAVPAVSTAASARLFRRQLLVKNGSALERLAEVDHVVFDKTGTLTEGQVFLAIPELKDQEIRVLRALSEGSSHPVSRAISLALPVGEGEIIRDVREVPGSGVEAVWQGKTVRLGRGEWVGSDADLAFRIGNDPAIPLRFDEQLRPGATEAVKALFDAGLEIEILSGDRDQAVANVANSLGVTRFSSEMLPEDKLARLEELRTDGRRVLMVGD
ncbi:MAG: HAD-IC family P-type ATPase, partial [Rhodobacteraceae bacterium]|nr:HAD-IC family P-type ATPase [Paracoccaceae bacterium]